MLPHVGEAAHVSTASVAGAQMAYDNWTFFNLVAVAMDWIGLDFLEGKRADLRLSSIRNISTHVVDLGRAGLLRTIRPGSISKRIRV